MSATHIMLFALVSALAGCATGRATALQAGPPPEYIVATWRLHAGRVHFHATAKTQRPARRAIRLVDWVRDASGRLVEVPHPGRADEVEFTLFSPDGDILQQFRHGPVDFPISADSWNGASVELPHTAPDGTYRFIARLGYEVDGLETPELFGVLERRRGFWQWTRGPKSDPTVAVDLYF